MNSNAHVLKICKAYQIGFNMGLNDDLNGFVKYVIDITLSTSEIQANSIGWDNGTLQRKKDIK